MSKKVLKKRYTRQRQRGSKTEVYDSSTGTWEVLAAYMYSNTQDSSSSSYDSGSYSSYDSGSGDSGGSGGSGGGGD